MRCKRVRKLLTAYMDGELPEEDHRFIAEHLETCEKCRAVASETKAVLRWAGMWRDREPSAAFLLTLKSRLRAGEEPSPKPSPLWLPRRGWALAGVAGAVLFVAGYLASLMVSGGRGTVSGPRTVKAPVQVGKVGSPGTESEDSQRLILGIQRIKMVFGSKLNEAAYAQLNEVQRVLAARDAAPEGTTIRVVDELQLAEELVRQGRYAEARRALDAISEGYPDHALAPYARMAKILTTPEPGYGSELLKGVYAMLLQETVGDPGAFYDQVANLPVQMARLREYGWQKITASADRLNPLNTLNYLERRILGGERGKPVTENDSGSPALQEI